MGPPGQSLYAQLIYIYKARCYLSWKFTTIRRPFFAIFRENFTQTKRSCYGYLSWKFTTIRRPLFAIFCDDALIWNRAHNQQIHSLPEINLNIKLKLTLTLFLTLTDTGGAVLTLMLGYRSFIHYIGTPQKSLHKGKGSPILARRALGHPRLKPCSPQVYEVHETRVGGHVLPRSCGYLRSIQQ